MKARDLFGGIATFPALSAAAERAALGKRGKPGVAAFLANREKEVLRLERELQNGSYRPGRYKTIEIFDPKHRTVSAAPFRDRVVHHVLCAVCEPIFERGFIFDSYANRRGKGTHRAVARYERFRDRFQYVLRCDLYRYFPSIDHELLKRDLRRRLACGRTLALVDRIIDGSNPQEPVPLHFPGDGLFTPWERRRGTRRYLAAAPGDLSGRVVRPVPGAWPPPCDRVLRGGSWNNKPRNLRSANRNRNEAGNRNNKNGFRVARTLDRRSRCPHGGAGRAASVQGRP